MSLCIRLIKQVSSARNNVLKAMEMWSDATCLTFEEITNFNKHYINLQTTGTGCNSYVGVYKSSASGQIVSLDKNCQDVATIIHELGHAIGLYHEQDRPDRDRYVVVYTENLDPKQKNVYAIESQALLYNLPYNYASIMQYGPYSFSVNGRMTLVPRDPVQEIVMGNAKKPSFEEYKSVNIMYNCSVGCNNNPLKCNNGGYKTWNSKKGCYCVCPENFGGNQCNNQIPPTKPKCGGTFSTPQSIKTPNYPQEMPANFQCAWHFKAPVGKRIEIAFDGFDMLDRDDKGKCVWDVLKARYGDLLSDFPGTEYCGNQLKNIPLLFEQNEVLLILKTYLEPYGHTGFSADVRFV